MRDAIEIQTVAGPAHATTDVLAAALAELLELGAGGDEGTDSDLLDATWLSLDEVPAARVAAA